MTRFNLFISIIFSLFLLTSLSAQSSQDRESVLNNYLEEFQVQGLKLGEPKALVRCPCEQLGIYLESDHLGDIYSKGMKFSKTEFMEGVASLLNNDTSPSQDKIVFYNKTTEKVSFTLNNEIEINYKMVKMWDNRTNEYTTVRFDENTHIVTFRYYDEKAQKILIEIENYDFSNSSYVLTPMDDIYLLNQVDAPQMR